MPIQQIKQHTIIFLSVAVAVFLFINQPAEAAPRCPGATSPAQLTLQPVYGQIAYRMGNTRTDLKRIQDRHAGTAGSLPGRWFPLGLTQAKFEMRMNTNVTIQPLSRQRFCAYPASIEVTIGYPEFTVWVDRRYRRGSCEYHAILDHELDHVRLYREQLRLHLDWLRGQITRIIQRLRPVTVASSNGAADRVQAQLDSRIRPLILQIQRASDQANAGIDTPSNYQSIHGLCQNW